MNKQEILQDIYRQAFQDELEKLGVLRFIGGTVGGMLARGAVHSIGRMARPFARAAYSAVKQYAPSVFQSIERTAPSALKSFENYLNPRPGIFRRFSNYMGSGRWIKPAAKIGAGSAATYGAGKIGNVFESYSA